MELLTPQGGTPEPVAHDVGRHWQRRYWTIFVGQGLSLIGSAMTQFVLLWWITITTQSAGALATAGIAALLPQAILGPIGGTFADRYSRRLLMITADLISALCMIVLLLLFSTKNVELWHVYTMMAVRSSMQAFQGPAASSSTAMLVPVDFLSRAAGLNQTLMGIMTVAAAPLGAVALGIMPLSAALAIDVVTAILGITPLLFYAIPQHRTPKESRRGVWMEFREGLSFVWSNHGLRHLYILLGITVLVLMPTFIMLPLFVKQYFRGGAGQVALMEGLSGAGMICGGILVTVVNPKRRVLTTLLALAVSCAALSLAALAPRDMFWLAVVWWTVSGVTFAFGNAPMVTILQSTVPNQLQGRVLSLLSTVMGLASPVGLAVVGPLAEAIGIKWVFVLSGFLGAGASLLGLFSRAMRQLEAKP